MLKTFILVATLANPSPRDEAAYVLDYDLSGADCVAALVEADARTVVELVPNRLWLLSDDIVLSCQLDSDA